MSEEGDYKQDAKHAEGVDAYAAGSPKLDPHGFTLRPQPTDDPMGTSIPVLNV